MVTFALLANDLLLNLPLLTNEPDEQAEICVLSTVRTRADPCSASATLGDCSAGPGLGIGWGKHTCFVLVVFATSKIVVFNKDKNFLRK